MEAADVEEEGREERGEGRGETSEGRGKGKLGESVGNTPACARCGYQDICGS